MRSNHAPRRRTAHRAPAMAMTTGGPPRPPIEPDLLDLAEVALRLNISRTTLWRLARRGDIRTVRIGGRTLVPRTELTRLIDVGTQGER